MFDRLQKLMKKKNKSGMKRLYEGMYVRDLGSGKLRIKKVDSGDSKTSWRLYHEAWCGSTTTLRYGTFKELLKLSLDITPENWEGFIR